MNGPNLLSLNEARTRIESGSLSPEDLLAACSLQIARLNPRLSAFITLMGPQETQGPGIALDHTQDLAGIPIAVKDLFETAGIRTTAGSRFFSDYIPAADATAVHRLRQAGALIIGKTNTHEIALGVTTTNPHYGTCRNPWDENRIPGGSSGGSAVAVATGMCLAALGTDTGGSIRIPASLCGVVGLKPTYGRVSLRGVFPLSWNLDHVGPIARNVEDAAVVLQVIAGYDAEDASSADVPVDDYSTNIQEGISGWRVALGTGSYVDEADEEVLSAIQSAADALRQVGARVEPVEVSFLREAALANGLMTQADGAAFHRQRIAEHPDWFGDDVRQRLEAGRDVAVADYVLARRTQTESRKRMLDLFRAHDILIMPSTPITAPLIGGEDAVQQARRLTRFTAPFNLTGLPAISIPCGFDQQELPIGLQMIAAPWNEARLLRAARAFERETPWSDRRPPASST